MNIVSCSDGELDSHITADLYDRISLKEQANYLDFLRMSDMADDETAVLNLFKEKLEEAMKLVPNLPSMDPSGMQMWLNALQSENDVQFKLSTTENGSIQITLIQPADTSPEEYDQSLEQPNESIEQEDKSLTPIANPFLLQPSKSKMVVDEAHATGERSVVRADDEWGFFHDEDGQVVAQPIREMVTIGKAKAMHKKDDADLSEKRVAQSVPASKAAGNIADTTHSRGCSQLHKIIVSVTTEDDVNDDVENDQWTASDSSKLPGEKKRQVASPYCFPCVRGQWYTKLPQDPHEDLIDDTCNVDTAVVANDLRSYLKVMSVSLESFAQTQLQRTQGTLSDLLNHPKPWKGLSGRGRSMYRKMMEFLSAENLLEVTKKLRNSSVRPGPSISRLSEELMAILEKGTMPSDDLIESHASELEIDKEYLRSHCHEQLARNKPLTEVMDIFRVPGDVTPKLGRAQPRHYKDKHICPESGCGIILGCKTALKTHLRTHTGLRPHKCSLCDKRFASIWNRQTHERRHAKNSAKISKRAITAATVAMQVSNSLESTDGDEVDVDRKTADDHTSSTEIYPAKKRNIHLKFVCGQCSERFPSKHLLRAHVVSSHSDVTLREVDHFNCRMCWKSLRSAGALAAHMRTHTGDLPYECKYCDKRFRTKANARRHVKTHTGERPYKCPKCPARFTESSSVVAHIRRHTGEKPFKCNVCGRGFAQRGPRDSHVLIHSDRRPFLCETCGRAFRQKTNLRAHELRHRGERRHSCDVCSRSFHYKHDLNRHVMKHKRVRPYDCRLCPQTFTRLHTMKEHMHKVHNVASYKCKTCGALFSSHAFVARHIVSCRGVETTNEDDTKAMVGEQSLVTEESYDATSSSSGALSQLLLKMVTADALIDNSPLTENKTYLLTVPRPETFPNPMLDPLSPSVTNATIDRRPSISSAMTTDTDPSLSSSHVSTSYPISTSEAGPVHVAIMANPALVFANAEGIASSLLGPGQHMGGHTDEHRLPVIAKIELPDDSGDSTPATAATANDDSDPNMQSVIVASEESDLTGTRFVVVSVADDVVNATNSRNL